MNDTFLNIKNIYRKAISTLKEDLVSYYDLLLCTYKGVAEFLENENIDVKDKIFLAQYCNDFDSVNKLKEDLKLSDYEKNKYEKLKNNNCELDETINFRILSEKYSFLDDILDMLVTDKIIQQKIISLSDSRLKLLELLYSKIKELTDYSNPYLSIILDNLGYSLESINDDNKVLYESLLNEIENIIESGKTISDDDISNLLVIFNTSNDKQYPIKNMQQLSTFNDFKGRNRHFFEIGKMNKNLASLKNMLFENAYGFSITDAKNLLIKYKVSNIERTKDNEMVLEMYDAISNIYKIQDPDVIIKLYEEFDKTIQPQQDFRKLITFENDMRKMFAHDLNNKVFKAEQNQNKIIETVNFENEFKEIIPIDIYDAGVDFKMVVTSVGSYQNDFSDNINYYDYWNSKSISSHGNCCSLIGNDNLSMASVKNVVFGFSNMSDNMLLVSNFKDVNSTPASKDFDMTSLKNQRFMDADTLLKRTRSEYNELVYERRDLSSNPKFYKKNPDYIVYIEDFPDKKDNQNIFENSLKAASQFKIPIVKISREKVAKCQLEKFRNLVDEFQSTKKPNLLSKIITTFESSRIGNIKYKEYVDNFFSSSIIINTLEQIKETIKASNNLEERNMLLDSLEKALTFERKNFISSSKYDSKKDLYYNCGFNIDKELEEIKSLKKQNINISTMEMIK